MVKVYKTQELTELVNRGWCREFHNGSDSIFQWLDAVCADSVPQIIQFGHSQLAFGGVDDNSVVAEALQNQPQMMLVLFGRCAGD